MTRDFGHVVGAALRDRGISIRAAAKEIHHHHSFLSRVIKGERAPTPRMAEAIDALVGAHGAIAAMVLPEEDAARVEHHVSHPSRVDEKTVKSLAANLAAQRDLDDHISAWAMIGPTESYLKWLEPMLRNARGKQRDPLAEVVAEWIQFSGWLHAEARIDAPAVRRLSESARLSREIESGPLLAQATAFQGWLCRQQGDFSAAVGWFLSAHETKGAHPAQRMEHAVQAAQAYASLGDRDAAMRLLDKGQSIEDEARASQAPGTAYWLTPNFQRLNFGLVYTTLGEMSTAADLLRTSLAELPAGHREAEWCREYRDALILATA
ncbi:helix-turn-helix domain-containing protein [Streptomyces xiamenensis]|uniref:helix-turn-helix domain-containing protein n=1 Tax=Streptomyces xiamenensis TaxID=408015 RepID=UPI0035DF400B